jgi:hypothetical protein
MIDDHGFEINLQGNHTSLENPATYKEAINRPDGHKWHQAALDEIQAHKENNTWTLVDLPVGAKTIKGRWIFTMKKDPSGAQRCKARFVAKGYSQKYGIDYEETYSSVLAQASLRILVCIAATNKWTIHQRDFTTAYLNASIFIPIFLEQPEGFVEQGSGKYKVCMLNKALYGLKQAGRAWQTSLFALIKSEGYEQSLKEPCIWFKRQGDQLTMIGTYVDDLLITGSDQTEIKRISSAMGSAFKMKDLGLLNEFLGIQAIHSADGILLTQQRYAETVIRRFGQENCIPASVPMSKTYEEAIETPQEREYPIREAIGALMYLANATRPDMAFSVNNLARHVAKPTKALWTAIQRILKYLKGTTHFGLKFTPGTFKISGWADSDYANDSTDRKSTSGWFFTIGNNPISWRSQKQKAVALSTTEAEYMAAADATREAIWLQDILAELGLTNTNESVLYQDNQGAIFIENNTTNKARTKHIDVRYHFIRQHVQAGRINVEFCPSNRMTADILTKPLNTDAFIGHRAKLMNESPEVILATNRRNCEESDEREPCNPDSHGLTHATSKGMTRGLTARERVNVTGAISPLTQP